MTQEEAKHIVDVAFGVPQAVRRAGEDRTYHEDEIREAKNMAIKALAQEPKTGHWIVASDGYGDNAYICECSECKDTVWVYKDADRKWNYCPNCGAKMKGEK